MTGRPLETLTHYPFERRIAEPEDNSEDDDDRMMQIHEQEMDDEEDEANKLPLAVPDPPSGISEFSLARYLFGNTCGVSLTLFQSPVDYIKLLSDWCHCMYRPAADRIEHKCPRFQSCWRAFAKHAGALSTSLYFVPHFPSSQAFLHSTALLIGFITIS